MSKDIAKNARRKLRPCWSYEMPGKGVKKLNRRIVRKILKRELDNEH